VAALAKGTADQRARTDRRVVLYVVCLSLLMVGLDTTTVNVALPTMGRDLHAGVSGLQWIVDAYVMVLGSVQLLTGSMADRLGRRRVFQLGLVLFTGGSLLCGVAIGVGWLIAFRAVQALGGSMLAPVAMSIIRNTFDDPRERAHAIGFWGAVGGLSIALGPVLGGVLVQELDWRAIFFVNLPIGLAALLLVARFVPETKAPRPRRIDPVGQVLVIVVLATLIYVIIEGPGAGWGSPEIVVLLGVAGLGAVALVAYELRRTDPLLELRFFRDVGFSSATVIALVAFASLGGLLFLNTLYLQDARGFSALKAGVYTLPLAAMVALASPIAGRIAGRSGPRLPLAVAGVALASGSVILVGLRPSTSLGTLFVSYALFGIGFGSQNPVVSITAVAGMPPAQAGVAAGTASTARQVGISLGVAVIGVAGTSSHHGVIDPQLTAATHAGWWIIVALGLLVLVLGTLSTTPWAARTTVSGVE
jgi:EmrB/QacA subfamily drug resistance transporter